MILNELYKLNELSPDTLASYKKAAGADATAADAAGDVKRGNKRFKGIVKATKKQFANDTKGVAEGVRDLGYDAQSLIFKLRRDVEEKRLQPTRQAVLMAARELAGDMDFAPELLVRQVLGQGVAEGLEQGVTVYGNRQGYYAWTPDSGVLALTSGIDGPIKTQTYWKNTKGNDPKIQQYVSKSMKPVEFSELPSQAQRIISRHLLSQGVAEGHRDRRDAYQRDQDNAEYGMNKYQSRAYQADGGANDERHDLDPTDWYVVKDGKMFAITVYPRQEQEAISLGYSRTKQEARAKANNQGVAEKLGDNRPKLGSGRDRGKSVRKWRQARGLDESGMAGGHNNSKTIITEPNKRIRIDESLLLQDPVYRSFKQVGRYLAERRMSEKEILQVFADAEAGMTNTATGTNRTMLGRGKDKATDLAASIRDSVNTVLSGVQNSVPVSAVDTAYDQATDALAGLAGGQKGAVMQAIKKYRMLVKKYPKSAGFAKAALVAITGLATGGASLPVIAGLTYALDAAIKGEKLSSVFGKGAGAAALAWAGQSIAGMFGADPAAGAAAAGTDPAAAASTFVPGPDLPTYTVQAGDTLSQIAQANDISVQELVGLNPQLAADAGAVGGQNLNPDVIFPGQEITLPPASGADIYAGGVGTSADTMADIAKGNVPDSAISRGASLERLGQATPSGAGPTNLTPDFDPNNVPPGMKIKYAPPPVRESVKLIRLPVSQLIDKKTTILNWKLNESIGRKSKTVNLTTAGAYTVFENVDRYRKAIMELKGVPGSTRPALYRPDMAGAPVAPAAKKPGLLSRGLSKVGGALSTFGRQFTTNVTKEKLKMNWHQKGKPSDSDQLAAWLVTQGVPQEVVTSVYSKMGLPVAAATVTATPTAPTVATPTAPTTATPTAPTTATPTTATATTTKPTAPAAAAGKFPGEDPQGAGYVGRREVARRQAARAAGAAKPAPAKTPNFSGPTGYSSVNTTVKQPAKQPAVAEGAMPAAVIRIKEKIRQMSDAEKKEYFQGKTREQLQQLARRHGYGENSNVYAKYAAQGLNEFAPGSGGDDDIGDDPYKYPKPTQYRRSADYFGQFEADHFEREDFDDATGVFKGYWGDKQIAYFKFNKPTQTGGDDPGRGWYYEPQSDSSDNSGAKPAADRSDERKQQELGMIRQFLKSGNRPSPGSQIYNLMKRHGIEEDLSRRGFLRGLGAAAAGAVGVGAAGSAQARSTDASRKEDAEALALLAKGMTPEQVAKKLGVTGPNHGQTHHMGGRWASINRATAQLQRQRGAEIKESVSASTVDELESMLKSAGLGRNG